MTSRGTHLWSHRSHWNPVTIMSILAMRRTVGCADDMAQLYRFAYVVANHMLRRMMPVLREGLRCPPVPETSSNTGRPVQYRRAASLFGGRPMDDRGHIHHLDETALKGLDPEYRKRLTRLTEEEAQSLQAVPHAERHVTLAAKRHAALDAKRAARANKGRR